MALVSHDSILLYATNSQRYSFINVNKSLLVTSSSFETRSDDKENVAEFNQCSLENKSQN